ncbi:MAG: hypothetical protein KDI08_08345, partial [Pseudomonadales bacterium]|nr:hypothetical protein [Pseudomonadales bacterium]
MTHQHRTAFLQAPSAFHRQAEQDSNTLPPPAASLSSRKSRWDLDSTCSDKISIRGTSTPKLPVKSHQA